MTTLALMPTLAFLAFPVLAAMNVPRPVREAIYPGSVVSVKRIADPLTVRIPLPDNTDARARPSARIKWVLVDTQPANITVGQTNTLILVTSGGTGTGATIAVSLRAASFYSITAGEAAGGLRYPAGMNATLSCKMQESSL